MITRNPKTVLRICVCALLVSQLACVAFSQPAPITAQAKVRVEGMDGKPIVLKQEEKIAFMFIQAIASMEDDCNHHVGRLCPLDELVRGPKSADWHMGKLKFDPAQDANYTYTITITGKKWEARANPRKKTLGGWYSVSSGFSPTTYYNPAGPATANDKRLGGSTIDGDSFRAR